MGDRGHIELFLRLALKRFVAKNLAKSCSGMCVVQKVTCKTLMTLSYLTLPYLILPYLILPYLTLPY